MGPGVDVSDERLFLAAKRFEIGHGAPVAPSTLDELAGIAEGRPDLLRAANHAGRREQLRHSLVTPRSDGVEVKIGESSPNGDPVLRDDLGSKPSLEDRCRHELEDLVVGRGRFVAERVERLIQSPCHGATRLAHAHASEGCIMGRIAICRAGRWAASQASRRPRAWRAGEGSTVAMGADRAPTPSP